VSCSFSQFSPSHMQYYPSSSGFQIVSILAVIIIWFSLNVFLTNTWRQKLVVFSQEPIAYWGVGACQVFHKHWFSTNFSNQIRIDMVNHNRFHAEALAVISVFQELCANLLYTLSCYHFFHWHLNIDFLLFSAVMLFMGDYKWLLVMWFFIFF
jgi:hypothetical protein